MRNYKYSMIFAGALSLLITSSEGLAYNCTQAPDCASLGYTMSATDCQDKIAVKCPTDSSKVFCKSVAAAAQPALPILYGDGTTSMDIISGKTPIGVVFDETNKLAVALTDVKQDGSAGTEVMSWSSGSCDTPGLQNCSTSEIPYGNSLISISCGADGRANTDAILASTCNGTTYAATAANSYQPTGCTKDFCKKTKWFLPSLSNLQNMYKVKDQLDKTLGSLDTSGATNIGNKYYKSSTEISASNVWVFDMGNAYRRSDLDKKTQHNVRPVISYGTSATATPTNEFQIVYSLLEIDCTSSPRSGKLTMRATATTPLPNAVTVTVKGNIPNNSSSKSKEFDISTQFPSGFTGGEQTTDVSVTTPDCLWLKETALKGVLSNPEGSITGLNSSWNVRLLYPEVTVIGNTFGNSGSGSGGGGGTNKLGVEGGYGDCQMSAGGGVIIDGGAGDWIYSCH